MIKMYIGGEEVVCDKEFTIKEEMLSTSSTILNNCYPKSWEQDHDYISRFYYPKDYSKCVIYDEKPLLPKEYTQVDYIESSGTQYIDTGILPSENIGFEIDFTPHNDMNRTTAKTIFGSRTTWKSNGYQLTTYTEGSLNGGHFLFGTNDTASLIRHSAYMQKDVRCQISFLNGIFKSANGNETNIQGTFSNVNKNIYLFGCIERTNPFELSTTTLYRLKFYDIGNLIRDFIPCYRNSDNEVGLYDLVNDVFYTNQGTGNFIAGSKNIQTTEKLLFAGMVKNSGNISLNPRYPKYCALEILDFKDFLSTGETLDFVINEKTVQEAIEMVVNAVSQYGFVLGNVNILNPNDVIGAYSTQNKSAYDVLQYLADISQSRWATRMIDENTVAIDFYDPTLMPSGIDIDYTKEWWCQNKVIDLTWNYGTRDYRNKQVMLSDKVFAGTDYNETIIADGYNTSFMTTSEIGLLKSILVNGESVSFATNEDKEIGIDAEFYYTPGENTITTDNSYSSGTPIVVTYTPLVKGREVIYNTDEVNRINLNTDRKGVIARYEQRNDVLSSDELEMIGQTYLKYKGSAEVILTLKTQEDIYNIGQTVYFNAPIQELATSYMVKKKSTEIIATTNTVFYTYELTSSFNSETAINWFDNQRNKTTGNISAGEYITRNYDIENTANIIWDNLTITEVNVTGANVLNAPLNSPFVE